MPYKVWHIARYNSKANNGVNREHLNHYVPYSGAHHVPDHDEFKARGHEIVATVVMDTPERYGSPENGTAVIREFRAITEETMEAQTRCPVCNGALILHYESGQGHQVMHSDDPCRLEPLPGDGEA